MPHTINHSQSIRISYTPKCTTKMSWFEILSAVNFQFRKQNISNSLISAFPDVLISLFFCHTGSQLGLQKHLKAHFSCFIFLLDYYEHIVFLKNSDHNKCQGDFVDFCGKETNSFCCNKHVCVKYSEIKIHATPGSFPGHRLSCQRNLK